MRLRPEIVRCRKCSGILRAEESFVVDEACRCETRRGRKAREQGMDASTAGILVEERPASLRDLLSDTGQLW